MDCRKPLKTLGNLLVWPPEASRRPSRHLPELPRGLQGAPRGLLEPPESPLEPLGHLLEPCRSLLEPLLERLKSLLNHSEPSWNLSWSLWKAPWSLLKPPAASCSLLEASLLLGPLGIPLGLPKQRQGSFKLPSTPKAFLRHSR